MCPDFIIQNLKTLASFWSLAGRFESYLVANPKDMFSHDMAHFIFFFFSLQSVKEHEDHFHKRCNRLEDEFRDLLTLDIRGPAQHSNGTETHFKTQL